ncbi:hypothetical protein C0995_008437 [Termitomyces sp. Mi166|nr:hypothetical protein C0995_008437 [Termitomyces sp. Mi166\
MGFLKRIFSLGSKKNKKQRPNIVHNVDAKLRALEEAEHEAAIGRLLRSSSTRYTVVSEVEYSSLPPLPPDDAIRTRGASTTSIASSTISRRGTYNVTVHKRKQHTPTDSQKANSGFPNDVPMNERVSEELKTKEISSHLLELRSHPSVASLLSMYDEHGCVPDDAFSNSLPSPEKRERPQTRRNGSTLRELLLGEPASMSSRNNNGAGSTEGDISWAERFLGEGDSGSSATSSVDLPTPTPNTNQNNDFSFATDNDFSTNTSENPDISSMEVELSIADSIISAELESMANPYKHSDPTAPQRASQVFQFLTERRRFAYNDQQDRSIPELPRASSVSSDGASPSRSYENHSHIFDDSIDLIGPSHPATPMPPLSQLGDIQMNLPSASQLVNDALTIDTPANAIETVWVAPKERRTENLVNAPTRVIITAPTPSGKTSTPSRIPRGPRSQYRRSSSSSNRVKRASTLTDRAMNAEVASTHRSDPFAPALAKHRQKRIPSDGSSSSTRSRNIEIGPPSRLSKRGSNIRSIHNEFDKENGPQLSVNPTLPSTPVRSKSDSRSLFRTAVTPSVFRPPSGNTPSPASSSELSPVGKQLMMDIRKQRSRARDVECQRSGARFGYRSLRT